MVSDGVSRGVGPYDSAAASAGVLAVAGEALAIVMVRESAQGVTTGAGVVRGAAAATVTSLKRVVTSRVLLPPAIADV